MSDEDGGVDVTQTPKSRKSSSSREMRAPVSPDSSTHKETEGEDSSTKNGKKSSSGSSTKSSKSGKSSKSKKDKEKSSSGKKDKKDKSSKDKERSDRSSGNSSTRDRDVDSTRSESARDRPKLRGEPVEALISPRPVREGSQRSLKSASGRSRRKGGKSSKKGVYFNKSVYVNTIPNLESYKPQEIEAVWFTPDEYASMEQECDETAAVLDANRPLAPTQCPRGLEAWTAEGEQNKEANVQEAIENVWQAQLEQWQMAQDTNECWEFIRGEYLPTSERCIQLAHHIALQDQESIQAYLNTTRQVFQQFARRVLGKSGGSSRRIVRRSGNDQATTPRSGNRRTLGSRSGSSRSIISSEESISSSRDASLKLSQLAINGKLKSSLKTSVVFVPDDRTIDEDASIISGVSGTDRSGSRKISRRVRSGGKADDSDIKSVGSLSYASTIESAASAGVSVGSGSRKISFKPKSKTKIPTSPVGSVADGSTMDESTNSRRMRSHMSVCSDDSTRRRMRKSVPTPLL